MKFKKLYIFIFLIIAVSLVFRLSILKKPDTRLIDVVQKGTFTESIKVSGVFNKTASDEQKAVAIAAYQSTLSTLETAKQNKEIADAAMWSKRQAVLTAQNEIDFKRDNTVNPITKKEYTDLEKNIIDSALVQAEKDFRAAELKYKEADIAITAALAQVNAAKIDYNDTLLNEPVITVDVNEVYAPSIKAGQHVKIVFDALEDKPLNGVVRSIDSAGTVTSSVVTFEAKIDISNVPPEVKPNMTAVVDIETIRKENTYAVPSSAVIYKNGKTYVQEINGQNNILTEVTIGEKGLTKVEILTGLNNGMKILVKPANNI